MTKNPCKKMYQTKLQSDPKEPPGNKTYFLGKSQDEGVHTSLVKPYNTRYFNPLQKKRYQIHKTTVLWT